MNKVFFGFVALITLDACSGGNPYDRQQPVCDGQPHALEFRGDTFTRTSDEVADDWISNHHVNVSAVNAVPTRGSTRVTYSCPARSKS